MLFVLIICIFYLFLRHELFYWPSNFIRYFILRQILHYFTHKITQLQRQFAATLLAANDLTLQYTFVVVAVFCILLYYTLSALHATSWVLQTALSLCTWCNDFHHNFLHVFQLTFIYAFVLFGTFFRTQTHYFSQRLVSCGSHSPHFLYFKCRSLTLHEFRVVLPL